MSPFIQFFYLQLLDLLTTIAFIVYGIQEGNPIVRLVLKVAPDPVGGLVGVKIVAVLLGVLCWRYGKQRLLVRVNLLFAVVVAWNMVALILGSSLLSRSF